MRCSIWRRCHGCGCWCGNTLTAAYWFWFRGWFGSCPWISICMGSCTSPPPQLISGLEVEFRLGLGVEVDALTRRAWSVTKRERVTRARPTAGGVRSFVLLCLSTPLVCENIRLAMFMIHMRHLFLYTFLS